MKIQACCSRVAALVLLSILTFQPAAIFAQGALTPPGAPAPTMKSLDQIEARMPVDTTNTPGDGGVVCKILQPGSYYLTGNVIGTGIKHGIGIYTNDVSIDLNGFSLLGNGSSGEGVFADAGGIRINITIRNGTVHNWNGGGLELSATRNLQLSDLRVSNNGGVGGIHAGNGAYVAACSTTGNSGPGISVGSGSMVFNCVAYQNTTNGIVTASSCSIMDSTATYNSSTGMVTDANCIIKDCVANNNLQAGILCGVASIVSSCQVSANQGDGIYLGGLCRVFENHCTYNSGAGIHGPSTAIRSFIDGNTVIFNTLSGLNIYNSSIYRNVIINNTNYVGSFNDIGPSNASPSTATSPWANF